MAESTSVGSLHYDLGIDDKNLEPQLDKADRAVKSFSEKLHDGLNKAAAGFAVVGAGLTLISKNATDFTVNFVKSSKGLATQIGTTTEEASRLVAAFGRMGVSADSASQMFGIFSKNIVKATADAKNGSDATASAFQRLSVSTVAADGTQKGFNAILFEVADKFKAMPNGIDKTSLAMELFGRSGKDMIKVLNLGSDGIKNLEEQADKLGLTLTSSNIAAVSEYIKSQKDLKQTTDALKIAIGTTTAPVLAEFNKSINDIILTLLGTDGPMKAITVNVLAFGGPIAGAAAGVLSFAANLVTAWPAIVATTSGLLGMGAAVIAATWPFILIGAAIAAAALLIITNWDSIWNFLKGIFNWIVNNWPLLLGVLLGPFGLAVGLIIQHFQNIKKGIEDFVAGAGKWLYNAGKDIIGGLIKGIEDEINGAVRAVKKVGGAVIDAARDVLHWHSPSKIFIEAGKSIGQGLAIGINRSTDLALNAMDRLGNNVISPSVNLSNGGSSSGAVSNGSMTTFGDTVVNIGQINNKQDEAFVLRRLDRNQQLEGMGISSAV